jgi:hypothetical protein
LGIRSWVAVCNYDRFFKAAAAIAVAPVETWIRALKMGFHLSCSTAEYSISDVLDILEGMTAEIEYHPENLIAGEGVANYPYHPLHKVRQYLSTSCTTLPRT